MLVVALKDRIDTSFSGYKKLLEFYRTCRDHTNQMVHIDFYELEWIDANNSALFEAILYKLSKENGLMFSSDLEFLQAKFEVLFRNGFLKTGEKVEDHKRSTVPSKSFDCKDKNGVCKYITEELMNHRGMPNLDSKTKEMIEDDLIEIFCNASYHSNTTDPIFVSGQYYPGQSLLKFTMVDLGDGFLPKINDVTKGKVTTSLEAIKWALEGNSSKLVKERTPGGLGISRINAYMTQNNGHLEIITGDGHWSSTYKGTIFEGGRTIEGLTLPGTTINLVFNK